jgi:hypothetical protein
MKNWESGDWEENRPRRSGRKINKERFCKKNRIGSGKYGSHEYNEGHCIRCGKIDPIIKRKRYGE